MLIASPAGLGRQEDVMSGLGRAAAVAAAVVVFVGLAGTSARAQMTTTSPTTTSSTTTTAPLPTTTTPSTIVATPTTTRPAGPTADLGFAAIGAGSRGTDRAEFAGTVVNAGPSAAENVVVSIAVSGQVTLTSTGSCTVVRTQQATCHLGTVVAGSQRHVSTPGNIHLDGEAIVFTFIVSSSTPDPDPRSNTTTSEVLFEAPRYVDLAIRVISVTTSEQDPSLPRGVARINYEATNAGPDWAIAVVRLVGPPGAVVRSPWEHDGAGYVRYPCCGGLGAAGRAPEPVLIDLSGVSPGVELVVTFSIAVVPQLNVSISDTQPANNGIEIDLSSLASPAPPTTTTSPPTSGRPVAAGELPTTGGANVRAATLGLALLGVGLVSRAVTGARRRTRG
jgi:hypothetical protein